MCEWQCLERDRNQAGKYYDPNNDDCRISGTRSRKVMNWYFFLNVKLFLHQIFRFVGKYYRNQMLSP